MYDQETQNYIRGGIQRGVVTSSNDKGGVQTYNTTILREHRRTDVEVLQFWGISTRPPNGSVAMLLGNGNDHGDYVAIPAAHPSQRLGNLKEGEVALYVADGSRVHLKQDSKIDIVSTKEVSHSVLDKATIVITKDTITVKVEGSTIEVKPDKITLTSPHVVIKSDDVHLGDEGGTLVGLCGGGCATKVYAV